MPDDGMQRFVDRLFCRKHRRQGARIQPQGPFVVCQNNALDGFALIGGREGFDVQPDRNGGLGEPDPNGSMRMTD